MDFFAQCRPRLLVLIDAGTTGALEEGVFMQALDLYDSLGLLLEGKVPATSTGTAGAGGEGAGASEGSGAGLVSAGRA